MGLAPSTVGVLQMMTLPSGNVAVRASARLTGSPSLPVSDVILSRSSTRTSPAGWLLNSVAEPAQPNPSRTPDTHFSPSLSALPLVSFSHREGVPTNIFMSLSLDMDSACRWVGLMYRMGAGSSSSRQPIRFSSPSVLPIWAPMTMTTRLNR